MENRFAVKDFFLFGLLLVLCGIVVLAMFQYDRQWTLLKDVQAAQASQATDLANVTRTVERTDRAGGNGGATAAALRAIQDQQARQAQAIAALTGEFQGRPGTARPEAVAVVPVTPGQALVRPPGPPPATGPNTAAPTTNPADDPFARQKAAEALPGYAQGDWFVTSMPNSDKLTPIVSGDAYAADVQGHVLQSLLTRDPVTLDWQPLLAQPGWTVEDHTAEYADWKAAQKKAGKSDDDIEKMTDGPVAVRAHFRIRPNATWSDGQPVTADDVVWTFNWNMNPAVEAPRARAYLSKIRSVTKEGTDGVAFALSEPYFDYLGLVGGMNVLPEHYYKQFTPEKFNTSACILMGSGPYMLKDPQGWTPGQQFALVRNDHYWGEPPAMDQLVYRIIIQDLPRLTAFTNGEIDDLTATPEQYQALLKNQAVLDRTQHYEYYSSTGGYSFIAWNQARDGKPTRFADKRVRQAMTLLTDRQRIADEIFKGLAKPVTGPFNPLGKQNDPAVQPYPFDPDRARQLLTEAGYTDDGSGQLKGPDGKPFEFRLTFVGSSGTAQRQALFLKDSYARAGINLIPDPLDWSVFSDRLKNRNYDAITLGWTAGIETDLYQIFDSSQIAGTGDDFVSYSNPKLDALIEQARVTIDERKRMDLWHQCHAILHEDQPYTFMLTRKTTEFMAKRIKNVQVLPLGINDSAEWFVPTNDQKWDK